MSAEIMQQPCHLSPNAVLELVFPTLTRKVVSSRGRHDLAHYTKEPFLKKLSKNRRYLAKVLTYS
jgi:hypothetical protein